MPLFHTPNPGSSLTSRLLTFVLCVTAVLPPNFCTCAATTVECHESHSRPVGPPVQDAVEPDHCCCHGHSDAASDEGPGLVAGDTIPPHEHSQHQDDCRSVTADPVLVRADVAGPVILTDAVLLQPVTGLSRLSLPQPDSQDNRPLISSVPRHISTVVLRI